MRSQATIFPIALLLVSMIWTHPVTAANGITETDTLLRSIGHRLPASVIEGTVSLEGSTSIGSVPFVAHIQDDTLAVVVSAPFGMTVGRFYVTPDTFIVVNYLSREVLVGHPESQQVASVSPIPLKLSDIRSFMRGALPGDVSRFQQGTQRSDGKMLFVARDSSLVEFALVDTATSTIAQYQRKKRDGKLLLNLVLGDVRKVGTSSVPYAIDVDLDDKSQAVRFRFDAVAPATDAAALVPPDIPSSFTRRVYAR